jgi:hypothetical protein
MLQRLFHRFRGDGATPTDLRAVLVDDVDPLLGDLIDGWPSS